MSKHDEITATPVAGWAIYLRVSDEDKQTPERSFAMQRQRIDENLLRRSDVPLHREYCDLLTGTSPKRADYQEMLADGARGKFSHLALYRADRFGRDAVEGLQAATKLISSGIKIRVAHMPSLCPETPDGFFMFMLQMGMAQREVEILRERTADGMETKLREGGWPSLAPMGYLNKEILVKSNKYHRWVEIDPSYSPVIRLAWDLLLTGNYTLKQICEELGRQGYTRMDGKPWAWTDSKTGERRNARSILGRILHNPFFAGWVVSPRFGIAYGEIRGTWEPIVSSEEFERGLEILRDHDREKSRHKRHFYLLRKLLWLQLEGKLYRMYASMPRGRSQYYPYYLTHAKPNGKQIHFACKKIDEAIGEWLHGITVDPAVLTQIRKVYKLQIAVTRNVDREEKIGRLQKRIRSLRDEELRLGRMVLLGQIGEETYDQLRAEWKEKVYQAEMDLKDLEQDIERFLDDLDVALLLLSQVSTLFARLDETRRALLLQIVLKRIIVNALGEIIDYELHSPFAYLRSITLDLRTSPDGSEQVSSGALGTSGLFCDALFNNGVRLRLRRRNLLRHR